MKRRNKRQEHLGRLRCLLILLDGSVEEDPALKAGEASGVEGLGGVGFMQ